MPELELMLPVTIESCGTVHSHGVRVGDVALDSNAGVSHTQSTTRIDRACCRIESNTTTSTDEIVTVEHVF